MFSNVLYPWYRPVFFICSGTSLMWEMTSFVKAASVASDDQQCFETASYTVTEHKYETPDTKRITFSGCLPRYTFPGECVIIEGNTSKSQKLPEQRAYIPIIHDRERQVFEVLVQRVKRGTFSNWLNSLQQGEEVSIKGPVTFNTNLHTIFQKATDSKGTIKDVYIIVQGSLGIACAFPLLSAILAQKDKANVHLLYSAKNVSDFALSSEILLKKKNSLKTRSKFWPFYGRHQMCDRLNTYFLLENMSWGWLGGYGKLTDAKLLNFFLHSGDVQWKEKSAHIVLASDSLTNQKLQAFILEHNSDICSSSITNAL